MKTPLLILSAAVVCCNAEWRCLFDTRYREAPIDRSPQIKDLKQCQDACVELDGCAAVMLTKEGCSFYPGHTQVASLTGTSICYDSQRQSELLDAAPADEPVPEAPKTTDEQITDAIAKVSANPNFPTEARQILSTVNDNTPLNEKIVALENALLHKDKMEPEDALELTTVLLAAKNEQSSDNSDDGVPWWAVLLPCLVLGMLCVAAGFFVMKDKKRDSFHSGVAQNDHTPLGNGMYEAPLHIGDVEADIEGPGPLAPEPPVLSAPLPPGPTAPKALPTEPYKLPNVFFPAPPTPPANGGGRFMTPSPSGSPAPSTPPPRLPIRETTLGRLPSNGGGDRLRPLPQDGYSPAPKRAPRGARMGPGSAYSLQGPSAASSPKSFEHIEI